ncbi:unnamed protein product [Urochloa decumbens]|uniref:Cytochrome P450 n=1 Tax=Urochloa decumbens TaxID=240449 RepID=A0ABC9HFE7_9POAL
MEYTPVLYFLLALLPLLCLLKSRLASRTSHHGNSLRLPPSPWQLPIIGSLHHLHGALPHHALRKLARRHGPIMLLKFGEVPVIVASSREVAKETLKTHDAITATRPQTTTFKILSKRGQGIALAPYGDHWRQLRKICNMELLSQKHVQSFRTIREDEAARLVQSIASASASPMNLSKMLAGYVADAALRAIMGDRLRDRDAFIQQLAEGVRLAAGFSLADFYPSSRLAHFLSRSARKAEIHRAAMLELMDTVIGEHMQRRSDGEPREEDMLDVLLRLQRDGGLQIPLTMDNVKAVAIDLFAGSNDTSATTLQWTMAELMRNPGVMLKLQDEVRGAFAAMTKVTEEGLRELSYLHMVIKETLRLHLPSPLLLPRESIERCQILGYEVPKGTMVMVNAGALSIDPEYWDEPEVFRPERFEDTEKDFKGNEFEFIPFGAGRRICPGMFFGLANIELALANLVFYFDWSLLEGISCNELDMTEAAGITVRKKSDLWVRATPHAMRAR